MRNMKKYDAAALGELLIDFTENGISGQGNRLMEANPGGAPCNVLAMLAKLGKETAFLGMVGQDSFGTLLREVLQEAGIETKGLKVSEDTNTTLAFVHTKPDGDREFSFYTKTAVRQREKLLKRQKKAARCFPLTRTSESLYGAAWRRQNAR